MAITNPKDISGLAVWYSADNEATRFGTGDQVTNLNDLSGLNNHATRVGSPSVVLDNNSGVNSGPALNWNASDTGSASAYFNLPNIYATATEGEIFYNMKPRVGASNYNGFHYFADSGNLSTHHPYQGVIYEGFLTSTRYNFNPPTDYSQWHRYNLTSTNGAQVAYWNGTQAGTSNGAFQVSSTPRFGIGLNTALGYLGLISTVVAFTRILTTTERADMNAWMVANPSGGTSTVIPDPETYLDLLPNGTTLVPVQTSPVNGSKRVTLKREPPDPEVGKLWLDTDV